jgi:hypothetical protein
MIAGDNDTCYKFSAGINNTSEQSSPVTTALVINSSLASMITVNKKVPEMLTLAHNLSPLSLTLAINYKL